MFKAPKASYAVLMCHAPIVIPEIGRERADECASSTQSMIDIANNLVAAAPDLLVVLSPHTPRLEDRFCCVTGDRLSGGFERFGHPQIHAEFPNANRIIPELKAECAREGVLMDTIPEFSLDHGAMVPLEFMKRAGWSGETLVLGFPYQPSHVDCRRLGRAIAKLSNDKGESWAILASGDMSHRLIPNAPAGFHPDAQRFDDHIVTQVRAGNLNSAVMVDERLRALAAEDVVDSLEIASAAIDFEREGIKVLSYEGPFGVGYMNAILKGNEQSQSMAR